MLMVFDEAVFGLTKMKTSLTIVTFGQKATRSKGHKNKIFLFYFKSHYQM